MPWDDRNLAYTVGPRYRPMTRCSVWRPKKFPPFFVGLFEKDGTKQWTKEDSHTNYHDWSDGTGRCKFCRKTRDEAREVKPVTLQEALKGN